MKDKTERFTQFIPFKDANECWEYEGTRTNKGYGSFGWGSAKDGKEMAHRAAWRLFNGPIPKGLSVLHKCDNPPCVNPAHLFLGTQRDNMRDASRKGRLPGPPSKPFCKKGHPIHETEKGRRYCMTCKRDLDRRKWLKKHPNAETYKRHLSLI